MCSSHRIMRAVAQRLARDASSTHRRCVHLNSHAPHLAWRSRNSPSSLAPSTFRPSPASSLLLVPLRRLFIQTQSTPNVNSLKFIPGRPVLPAELGYGTLDFSSLKQAAARSPLAAALFHIEGVRGVLLSSDFLSVNVEDGSDWAVIKPAVYAAIMDFFASNQPVVKPDASAASPAADGQQAAEEDSEVVSMIRELIESRIRPAVQEDGGDIAFVRFDSDTGVVHVQMQGSCKGCSSSSVTLKNGIENMLMHYVPEVSGVEEWKDEQLEQVSNEQLRKLEEGLKKIKQEQQRAKETTAATASAIASSA